MDALLDPDFMIATTAALSQRHWIRNPDHRLPQIVPAATISKRSLMVMCAPSIYPAMGVGTSLSGTPPSAGNIQSNCGLWYMVCSGKTISVST